MVATIFFGMLLVPSFFAAWAQDVGRQDTNLMSRAFTGFFNILRFPTHTLFWSVIVKGGALLFFPGLLINCLFYGLLTERLYSIIKRWKK